jgi:sodium/proline symporter
MTDAAYCCPIAPVSKFHAILSSYFTILVQQTTNYNSMDYNVSLFIVMISYMAIIIGWGVYQGRKVKNSTDFAIAGRNLPGWVAALSERSTGESSWALLGLPGAAYATGLLETWTAIGCVLGVILAWVFIAPKMQREAHKYNSNTFTQYIAQKHGVAGKWIRMVGSTTIVFFFFFYVGAQFIGGGKTLENLFGVNRLYGMLLVVLLVVPYTIYGGFRSVTYTDVIQAIVMIITLIIAPIAGLHYLKSQPESTLFATSIGEALAKAGSSYSTFAGGAQLQADSVLAVKLNTLFPNSVKLINGLGAGILLAGAFSWFFGYLGGQPQLTMRFMAIRDEKQAKQARNIGVVWTIIAYAGALMIGWIGIAIFGPKGLTDQETVMPEVLTTLFNPVVAGILITGVLAAIISTANSLLILSSTELSENLIAPIRKSENKKDSLFSSRLITAILSLIALLLAYFSRGELIYAIVSYVWAGIGGTFSVIIILTLYWKRYHGFAALATIIGGLLFTVIWINTGMEKIITSRLMTFLVALTISVVTTIVYNPQRDR